MSINKKNNNQSALQLMLMLKRAIKKNYIKKNSCDKYHFNKAAPDYNIALKIVG